MLVVLDKSYFLGAKGEHVRSLLSKYCVLMPGYLFMELISGDRSERAKCFNKLPKVENPIGIIERVSTLLQYEMMHKKPCTPLEDQIMQIRYIFNPKTCNVEFDYSEEQIKAINEYKSEVNEDAGNTIQLASVLHEWFPELKNIVSGNRDKIVYGYMEKIAENKSLIINKIFKRVRRKSYPSPNVINEKWAFYRKIQTDLFIALEFIRRYGNNIIEPPPEKFKHYIPDREYCITAALGGGLATRDKTLASFFGYLCRDGFLIS